MLVSRLGINGRNNIDLIFPTSDTVYQYVFVFKKVNKQK